MLLEKKTTITVTMISVTTMVAARKKMNFNGTSSGNGDKSIEVVTQGMKRVAKTSTGLDGEKRITRVGEGKGAQAAVDSVAKGKVGRWVLGFDAANE